MNAIRTDHRLLLGRARALVGMVHFRALPGTPSPNICAAEILAKTVAEARQLKFAGFDPLIVENMHDRPYLGDASGADTFATF